MRDDLEDLTPDWKCSDCGCKFGVMPDDIQPVFCLSERIPLSSPPRFRVAGDLCRACGEARRL